MLGEADASVNLVAGEDCDSDEDEEWWVNTVRVEEEGENLEELEDSELEESGGRADRYCISACMRKDDSGLEDEPEYFRDAPIPQIQTNGRRTDGGLRGPRGRAPRRMRRRSGISSACSGASPKRVATRKERLHPKAEL